MFTEQKNKELSSDNVKISFPIITSSWPLWITFFILLLSKLYGNTPNMSWWWVTCPIWAPAAIFLGIMGIMLVGILAFLIIYGIVGLICVVVTFAAEKIRKLFEKKKKVEIL